MRERFVRDADGGGREGSSIGGALLFIFLCFSLLPTPSWTSFSFSFSSSYFSCSTPLPPLSHFLFLLIPLS